jgi:thiamine monophosphate synthase
VGWCLLIGQDAELAAKVGAHGVHLPERAAARARRLRAVRPRWIITLATHSAVAVARSAHCGVDGVFLSAIFQAAARWPARRWACCVLRRSSAALRCGCLLSAGSGRSQPDG